MIKTFLNKILLGNRIQAVQIHLEADRKEYCMIQIHKKKNDIEITDRYVTNNFDELIAKLSKNIPVVLSFSGQGIVSKKVNNDTNYQSKIVFNANPDDFYWYEYRQEDKIYVSVVRKELVNTEVKLFEKTQISIVDFSLGSFAMTLVKPLINDTVLYTEDTELFFENEVLVDFKKINDDSTHEYIIGDEKLSNKDVICFASVLNYLYPSDTITSESTFLSGNREEFMYRKAFNVLGICTLSFFMITLLISYLLLGHYQQADHKVQVELGQQNVAYSRLVSLEKDKKNKETILKQSGLSDSNFLSFYISEITKGVPAEINLVVLNVFPTISKIKAEQRINFSNNIIELEGTVSSNLAFAAWTKELKKKPWVHNLEIIDLQRENKTNSFKIKLILKFDV